MSFTPVDLCDGVQSVSLAIDSTASSWNITTTETNAVGVDDNMRMIAVAPNGEIYAAYHIAKGETIPGGISGTSYTTDTRHKELVFAKFSSSGELIWQTQEYYLTFMGGRSRPQRGTTLNVHPDGSLIVACGDYNEGFGVAKIASNGTTVFVKKYSNSGTYSNSSTYDPNDLVEYAPEYHFFSRETRGDKFLDSDGYVYRGCQMLSDFSGQALSPQRPGILKFSSQD